MSIFYISLFGVFGVLARYAIGLFVARAFSFTFPLGTFGVNLLGSFLIGVVYVIAVEKNLISENLRLAIMIGFLGGFTTFSSYTLEGARLIEEARYLMAGLYLALSPLLGLMGTFLGLYFARFFFATKIL